MRQHYRDRVADLEDETQRLKAEKLRLVDKLQLPESERASLVAQENEIAKDQSKAAKLPQLTLENEKLMRRLTELKQQLPEEKEISSLLKQVSDLCIRAGLKVSLWKPEGKRTHPSGIVYEIPVRVELSGSYHNLGYFFSSLTKLNRIVNISEFRLSDARPDKGQAILRVGFTAATFSSVPESEIPGQSDGKQGKEGAKTK